MKAQLRHRVLFLAGCVVFFALLLMVRLYLIQVVHGASYADDARQQYVDRSDGGEERGTIYFQSKDGDLEAVATMQSGYRIAIVPSAFKNPEELETLLTSSTAIFDPVRFKASIKKTNDPYEEVASRVDEELGGKIRSLKLPGVVIVRDQWRVYPNRNVGAHVVGFIGYNGTSTGGQYGLEREFESTLLMPHENKYMNPFAQLFAETQSFIAGNTQQGDVVTTIEPNVERAAEGILAMIQNEYTPKKAGIIVMDPRTGEIRAMVATPSYDPNTFNTESDVSVFSNPLVEGRYEMGSIMKPLTIAGALDAGVITPESQYIDTGCVIKSEKKICNFDGKARGKVNTQEILNQSLNVGIAHVVDVLGQAKLKDYFENYFLGTSTNIDLPSEVSNDLHIFEGNSDVDYASAGFGQGIAVSPVAMIRALSTLAHDGVPVSPHVVKEIRYPNGLTKKFLPLELPRAITTQTAHTTTSMLVTVVDKALLKGTVKNEHYAIAAKTGTAQMAINGGYDKNKFLHSFFGYFPAHDPQFIVFLFAVEPHGAEFASATLAKPFMHLVDFLIKYYSIPPDR